MKESSVICFLYIAVPFCLISCFDDQTKVRQWTRKDVEKFIDSTKITNLVAAYGDINGNTFIIKNKNASNEVVRLTYVPNFPVITDTLVQTGIHEFKSRQFRTTYFINDSEIVITYHQKIIHPSSNWQGQTPWQETILATYPRFDRKLK
jgi:hypothetical protein